MHSSGLPTNRLNSQAMLNFDQLQIALAAAKKQFGLLIKKHPDLIPKTEIPLPPYLVIALPGEQIRIEGAPKDFLKKIPGMVIDSNAKTKALALLSRIKLLELQDKANPDIEQLMAEVNQLASQLQYDDRYQVEIRFQYLDYDLIPKLQVDDLIDCDLTPQGKASIRIILGTLGWFNSGKEPQSTIPPKDLQ